MMLPWGALIFGIIGEPVPPHQRTGSGNPSGPAHGA